MPKLNAIAMVVLAAALIGGLGWYVLGHRHDPSESKKADVERALRKLADADPDVRRDGEALIRAMGSAGVEVLKETAKSTDRHLAARAEKLLREAAPAPRTPAEVAVDVVQAPVRFEFVGLSRDGDVLRAYVSVVNHGTAPILFRKRDGAFQLEDEKGVVTRVAVEGGDETIVVLPNQSRELGAEGALPIAPLPAPGSWRIRFVYDATDAGSYRRDVRASERGALLPPLLHLSNIAEIVVR